MAERKVGPPPDDVKDIKVGPGAPGKHWSILDGIKDEMRKSGRSGIIITVEPDGEGRKKLEKFLVDNHCEGTTKKPYLIIEHATQAKDLFKLAKAAGLTAEWFEPKK
jgi:hypothetical protein